jgi:formylglycine-generating enzyme required for sulfatase activity/tRNA A-37 threonylcarbamoyl transferase component Bud32
MSQQHLRDLPSAALDRLEVAVRAFEDAWQQGKRPAIDAALPAPGPERRAVLIELIHVDLECRLRAGQPVRVEHYLKKYSELKADTALVIDFLVKEERFRRAREPQLTVDEYVQRFPALKEALQARWQTEIETVAGSALPNESTRPAAAPPSTCTMEEFVRQLAEMSLMTEEQRRELAGLRSTLPDPTALAGELVRRGWLTRHQSHALLAKRGAALVIGPYVVLDRLGEGGMGQVFKARHQVMKRLVAVKVIRKGILSYGEQVQRFYREIEAVARLSHPNIVLAHDAGRVGDVHFFAMEYVEGTDLARKLREHGPVPVDKACGYIRQAALGLQHAHERGLVHRDIKPSNLLVCPGENGTEVVKILDLGLARIHESNQRRLTQIGEVMGTADYIAPEQATDASQVDIRADIYSLGCTLYHLIAGQPVFVGGSMVDKLRRHQKEEPKPLGKIRALPTGLETVIGKMMAKRPEDRYQTPQETAAALTPFCGQAPAGLVVAAATPIAANVATPVVRPDLAGTAAALPLALPTATPVAPPGFKMRRRRLLLGAGGTALVLVGLLAWWFWPRSSAPTEHFTNTIDMKFKLIPAGTFRMGSQDGESGRQLSEGPQHEVKISKAFYLGIHEVTVGQFRAFVEATGHRTEGEKKGIFVWDGQAVGWKPEVPPKLSWRDPGWPQTDVHPVVGINWEDAVRFCQWLSDKEGKPYRLPTEAEWEYACRAGTTTAYSFGDSADRLEKFAWIDTNAGGKTHPVGQLAPNPWGLFDMHGNACECCVDTFHADFYMDSIFYKNNDPDFSKNKPRLRVDPVARMRIGFDNSATSWRGGWIYKGKADARSAYRTWAPALTASSAASGFRVLCELPAKDAQFDPQFLDAMNPSQIPEKSRLNEVNNLVGVLEAANFHLPIYPIYGTAFSADGRYLVSQGSGTQILWDLQTRAWFGGFSSEGGSTIAFSPDSRLTVVTHEKERRLWDVFTNVPLRVLEESAQPVANSHSFSPDGKQVISGERDGTMRLWNVSTGKLVRKITVYEGNVRSARYSADGQRVLTSPVLREKADSQVFLWETATWNKVGEFAIDASMGSRAEFAPAGYSFAFGNKNGDVHYWNLDAATPLLIELKGSHANEVIAVTFTPDGKKLVTADLDGKIVLWDLATKVPMVLAQLPGRVLDVKLSPDGRYLAFPCEKTPGKVYIARMPGG